MQVIDPGGNGERIEAMWVYLVQHGRDDESVAAVRSEGQWFPLVATTDSTLQVMSKVAQHLATKGGKPLMLARFDRRADIGKVLP